MNEIEKALSELKGLLSAGISGLDLEMFGMVSEDSFRLAISALEKQIPKKVTKVKCIHDDYNTCLGCEIIHNCDLGNKCPACGEGLDYDYGEKNNYCHECGQRMDWSAEE